MSTWFQQLLPRGLLRRAGRGIAGAPVSASLALLTVGFSAASALPGSGHRLARTAAAYHGRDLMRAALWRLPLSALLAQSVLQLLWTLLLMSTLFTALEHVVGGVKLLLIAAAGHVLPTVAVDLFAMCQRWPRWLATADYGTSCLIMGVIAALLLLTRNRMLMGALMLVLAIDGVLNSVMTVSEHLLALLAGALTCQLLSGGGNNPTSKVVTPRLP
jgi:hypothetical protein